MSEKINSETRILGRAAHTQNIEAAIVLSDIIKTTLGPKGMDKFIVDAQGNTIISNDGVTILNEMDIKHPAAKIIVETASTQENEIGDGTTTVTMLAGKLLENALKLIKKNIHPTTIIKGYSLASEKCLEILNEISEDSKERETLKQIAMTAMTGKGAEGNRERLSEIIVRVIEKLASKGQVELDNIKITKSKGKEIEKSEMVDGVVLEYPLLNEKMPKKVKNASIALLDFDLEIKNPEKDLQIRIQTPQQLQAFLNEEQKRINNLVGFIVDAGANVVFCKKGIDDLIFHQFAQKGILAVRRVTKYDMDQLVKAVKGNLVSVAEELKEEDLGKAGLVEEEKNREDSLIYVRDCENPGAITILMHGTTSHVLDETVRALTDGIGDVVSVFKDGKIVSGGGAVEIELSRQLRKYAHTLSGREQLAVLEFANTLEFIPETLAENAGLDSINLIAELKTEHDKETEDSKHMGLNLFENEIENTFKKGIIEPMKIKTQAIKSATEVTNLILRCDDILLSKPE